MEPDTPETPTPTDAETPVEASPAAGPADPAADPAADPTDPAAAVEPARPRRSRAALAWIIVLAVLVAAALGVLASLVVQLLDAHEVIEEQRQEISELDELVDTKETFGAAMQELMDTARELDGAPMADLVDFDDFELIAQQAWTDRRSATRVRNQVASAQAYTTMLQKLLDDAEEERSSNATGTLPERVLDSAGGGFASLVYDDADALCDDDVIGCVSGTDPYVVHLDRADLAHPSVDDWGRRLVTLHEYAHVLQYTNPGATEAVVDAFDDDWEFMADCYALRETGSWSLDRRVWTSAYSYWDTSYGYGRVCDAGERKVIGEWIDALGVEYRPVSQ